MLRHPPSQVDLLKADIDRLRDELSAVHHRHDDAVKAKRCAEGQVFAADAEIVVADVLADDLRERIDGHLDELAALLPEPRNSDPTERP